MLQERPVGGRSGSIPDAPFMNEFPGLIEAMIQVESGGDDNAIGDKNLKHKAYGCLQIRQPYVDDTNRVYKTRYLAKDCLGDRSLSMLLMKRYMAIYATPKRLGRAPTAEDIARIHNGGPDGYKKPATEAYWSKVKQHYKPTT